MQHVVCKQQHNLAVTFSLLRHHTAAPPTEATGSSDTQWVCQQHATGSAQSHNTECMICCQNAHEMIILSHNNTRNSLVSRRPSIKIPATMPTEALPQHADSKPSMPQGNWCHSDEIRLQQMIIHNSITVCGFLAMGRPRWRKTILLPLNLSSVWCLDQFQVSGALPQTRLLHVYTTCAHTQVAHWDACGSVL